MKNCKVLMQRTHNLLIKMNNNIKILKNRIGLKNRDFTIISNNCWGGDVYQMFGLEYKSPTIGLFLYEQDYIKFVKDIKKYLCEELIFIDPCESKYYSKLIDEIGIDKLVFPIARLLDVEVMFLHYKTNEEAKDKWERRKKRINYDKILYKLSDRTDSSEKVVKEFCELDLPNKICFVKKYYPGVDGIVVEELNNLPNGVTEKDCTMKYINIKNVINSME